MRAPRSQARHLHVEFMVVASEWPSEARSAGLNASFMVHGFGPCKGQSFMACSCLGTGSAIVVRALKVVHRAYCSQTSNNIIDPFSILRGLILCLCVCREQRQRLQEVGAVHRGFQLQRAAPCRSHRAVSQSRVRLVHPHAFEV